VTPAETIYRTEYDGLGPTVSQWVGTDDTPTTGNWSVTNTAGTDMVKVSETEYDGGGDGNLTTAMQFPGGGAADRRGDQPVSPPPGRAVPPRPRRVRHAARCVMAGP